MNGTEDIHLSGILSGGPDGPSKTFFRFYDPKWTSSVNQSSMDRTTFVGEELFVTFKISSVRGTVDLQVVIHLQKIDFSKSGFEFF